MRIYRRYKSNATQLDFFVLIVGAYGAVYEVKINRDANNIVTVTAPKGDAAFDKEYQKVEDFLKFAGRSTPEKWANMYDLMETCKWERQTVFVDSNSHRVKAEIELSYRNGYPEFTVCTQSGQGRFSPINAAQEKLNSLWETHHLKEVSAKTLEIVIETLDRIEEIEAQKNEREVTLKDLDLFESFGGENKTALALAFCLDVTVNQIEEIEQVDGYEWNVLGECYIAGTQEETDKAYKDVCDGFAEDFAEDFFTDKGKLFYRENQAEINETYSKYVYRSDEKVVHLNRYDGETFHTVEIEGTLYEVYPQDS